ncbi:hypothetical protein JNB91_20775 [Rhizobium wenxiniae]|uniref:hypothetical protein n=1 Tax=Rhizobium wenxiniae TaxID=1737357 RepID=UPI001C6DF102|nr:hypothetical protein [Rhizobium wenxiniae]MBW9090248.1 hypothetical protein [Rhizobium wenxiniae]
MPWLLPFLPDALAGGARPKYRRRAYRTGAAHYYTIAGCPQAATAAFCSSNCVSFMTRRCNLFRVLKLVFDSLSVFVSEKLTNIFLTFASNGASLVSACRNREVNDRFLFIPHAIS